MNIVKNNYKLKIIGLRVEKYVGTSVDGHNCDFTYTKIIKDKYVLCVLDQYYNSKYEITLWDEEGECGSGWCLASFGNIRIKQVNVFAGFSYVPINNGEFKCDDTLASFLNNSDSVNFDIWDNAIIKNTFFKFDSNGGCNYYPSGSVSVNMDMFKENGRKTFTKRPVWIFSGDSCLGKSYLGCKITDKSVYETDSNSELPEVLYSSIIIIGNKYKFDVEDVKSRIFGDCEIINVNFNG